MSRRLPTVSTSEILFAKQQCKIGTISLRHQLAQEGCTESQLTIAKSLLDETELDSVERKTNSSLAVYWLLLAAENGSTEAIKLLRDCSNTGIGINNSNCFAVAKCLRLSDEEVISRRIGHSIVAAIMSDAEDAIPDGTFQEKVEEILCENKTDTSTSDVSFKSTVSEEDNETPTSNVDEHCISVSDVITSVQQCLEGNLPIVTLKRVAQYEEYNKWFSLKYARKLSTLFRSAFLTFVQDIGSTDFPLVIFLCLILMGFLSSLFTIEGSKNFPTDKIFLFTVLSMVIMQSSTCNLVKLNIGLVSINRWLDLITLFEPTVKSQEIRQKYMEKNFISFLMFFCASLVFIGLFPANRLRFVSPELFLFSIIMFILLDRTITNHRDYVNISLIINIIICLNKQNLLDNLNLGWLQYFNFNVCFSLSSGYEMHLNWLSCLTFFLPYVYTKMSLSCKRKGWHLVLLPHLMSLTWMNLAGNFYASSERDFLCLSLAFWILTLFLGRYLGSLVSVILACIAKAFYIDGAFPSYSILIQVLAFGMCIGVSKLLIGKLKTMFQSFTLALLLWAVFSFLIFFKLPLVGEAPALSQPVLPWNKYETHCHRHAWYRSNAAEVEIACLPLKGKRIEIEGTVTSINIVSITNHLNSFVSILPSPISEWVTCALGDNFCQKEGMSAIEKERCSLYDNMKINHCNLQNWNTYEYQILVEVYSRTSPEVHLKLGHKCSSFIKTLKEGDSLQFIGIIDGTIGNERPEFVLEEATCNTCPENLSCSTKLTSNIQFDFGLSFRYIVKFYLSPFIQSTY